MQKWCPDPLTQDLGEARVPPEFQSGAGGPGHKGNDLGFEKDLGLGRRESLWEMMSLDEQEKVLDQARLSLREEFQAIEKALSSSHEERLQEVRAENDARFDIWSSAFAEERESELRSQAREAASLALAMARKIIRDTVEVDPGFVVRTIETALFKVKDTHQLTVTVHPEDAAFLNRDPELKNRLRIEQVIPDRRVAKGGCRVRAGVREWDATISSQLESLSGLVEEVLAAEALGGSGRGDADADSLA